MAKVVFKPKGSGDENNGCGIIVLILIILFFIGKCNS